MDMRVADGSTLLIFFFYGAGLPHDRIARCGRRWRSGRLRVADQRWFLAGVTPSFIWAY